MPKRTIASLEKELKEIREKLRIAQNDRDLYRNHLVSEFRIQRKNANEGRHTPAEWQMSRIAQVFAMGESFYWRQDA